MTGKELLLVLAGTVAVAGAGGVGAASIAKSDRSADRGADEQILARLDALQESIDDTQKLITESDETVARLGRRMERVERGLGAAAAARPSRRHRVDPSNASIHTDSDSSSTFDVDMDAAVEGASIELGRLLKDSDSMKVAIDEAMAKAHESLGDSFGTAIRLGDGEGRLSLALGSFGKSMELRRLPEEERWQKAIDDVGLNDTQVTELQAAIEERDEAMKAAMNVEKSEQDDGGHFTVKRMDFEKAREAGTAYRKRVDNALNDQQRKDWREKGYDGAFGNSASGGTTGTVISISSFGSSSSSDETKE